MSLGKLRNLCVTPFQLSQTRREIFRGLITLVRTLRDAGVKGKLWVDGSFLTIKIDPEDVDVVLRLRASDYDAGTQEFRDAVDWLSTDLKTPLKCDSYIFMVWPDQHALHYEGVWMEAYWLRQYGFSRTEKTKGIAVIELT